jgi:hypothetical protein
MHVKSTTWLEFLVVNWVEQKKFPRIWEYTISDDWSTRWCVVNNPNTNLSGSNSRKKVIINWILQKPAFYNVKDLNFSYDWLNVAYIWVTTDNRKVEDGNLVINGNTIDIFTFLKHCDIVNNSSTEQFFNTDKLKINNYTDLHMFIKNSKEDWCFLIELSNSIYTDKSINLKVWVCKQGIFIYYKQWVYHNKNNNSWYTDFYYKKNMSDRNWSEKVKDLWEGYVEIKWKRFIKSLLF